MEKVFDNIGLNDWGEVADFIFSLSPPLRIIALKGNLGAGKTTFIKTCCERLGVVDTVSSPTFSIINEYLTKSGDVVYHMDAYRLESEDEAINIGVEELFFAEKYCFIEWPDVLEGLLPESFLCVDIQYQEKNRKIIVNFS